MNSRLRRVFIIITCCLCATAAHAAEAFVLPYRAQNHWVHQDDNTSLVNLMNSTAKSGIGTLTVTLPEGADMNLYVERLKILRNLLMRKTTHNIIIRQIAGTSPANTITVTPNANLNN
ncbi:MAG: hypothetical protein GC134_02760 [Proteobacteria bacterium]|nr:hypothetical protein [Pseudomonadota bacterium]